jgi:hypothetical protein
MTSSTSLQTLNEQRCLGNAARRTERVSILKKIGSILALTLTLTSCGGGKDGSPNGSNETLGASASQGTSGGDATSNGGYESTSAPGGATSVAGVSSGGTGSLSVGVVTGFGSIILNGNGVHIDDTSASVIDEDGADKKGLLRLGMQVTVESSTAASGAVTAKSVVISGDLQGPVERVDVVRKRLVVLGQTVIIVGGTVFDASLPRGLASVATNELLEVHGLLNAERNELTATFIEKKASVPYYKIRGLLEALDGGNKTLSMDNLEISFAVAEQRGTLVPGTLVRVRVPALAQAPALWQATLISGTSGFGADREKFEIEGRISQFVSATSFSVDGLPVDASTAVFANGTAALASGVRVEVLGRLTAGRLIATQVKIEEELELDQREFELTGRISELVINGSVGSFELRGQSVEYNSATQFRNGAAAQLVNGALLEVRGMAVDGGQGTRIAATLVEFQ